MKARLLFIFLSLRFCSFGQGHNLAYYVDQASVNSPLLKDYRNQQLSNQVDSQLLRASYRPQVVGLSNDIYAPVISGYGYDNAITNGAQLSAFVQASKNIISAANLASQHESIRLMKESVL